MSKKPRKPSDKEEEPQSREDIPRKHRFMPTAGCVFPMDDGGSCDALEKDHPSDAAMKAERPR